MRRAPIRPPRYTVNGPINIRPMSKAVPIHALSSYPNPWRPLKSGMPREIIRLVSVTTPAPVTTPRIPSSGCAETSAGTAAPTARAISIGDGRTVTLEAAILFRLPPRPDGCNHRESGAQFGGKGAVVQRNLDRDALYHLREIAGRVVGRQQRKLGSAGWCDFQHLPMNYLPGILVNPKFGSVADLHVGQLGFTIVRLHPLRDINKRDHLRARRYKLSCPDLPFAHSALAGCVDFRVAKIHHSCREVRLLCAQIGLKLHILRLDDCFRTPLGFRSEFTATQHRLSLFEIGVAARELCRQALVIGHRPFHLLLRCRMSLIQTLLALALGVGANQVRTYGLSTSFSCGDLRLCLIDTGKRFGYARVLQLALAVVVFDGGTGSLNCCSGLVNLRSVVVVLQFHNEGALVDSLKVGYVNRAHDAGHLRAQRRKVAAHVSIISYLFDLAALPRIPVASDSDQNR